MQPVKPPSQAARAVSVTAKMTYMSAPPEEEVPLEAPDIINNINNTIDTQLKDTTSTALKKVDKEPVEKPVEKPIEKVVEKPSIVEQKHDPDWAPPSGSVENNSEEIEWPCNFCPKRFQKIKFLTSHHRNKHPDETLIPKKVYQCQECPRFFTAKKSLRNHTVNHLKRKTAVQCNICNEMVDTQKELKEHMKGHTEVKVENSVAIARNLELIKQNTQQNDSTEVEEDIDEDVEEDVDDIEVQDESLTMDVTDEIFSSIVEADGFDESTLDEALDNLEDKNDSENADMSITSCFVPVEETPLVVAPPDVVVPKETIEVPMDAAEAEEEDWYDEEWTCGNCPKRFAAEKFLNSHHTNKHNELTKITKKVFACRDCSKSFAILRNMKNHRAVHNKGIKCDQCDMEFRETKELNKHTRTFDHSLGARIDISDVHQRSETINPTFK